MKPAPHTLLTKEEAKVRLGLGSDSALRRLILRGKLRVVKYGLTSPLRFRRMDIDARLESCAVTGEAASPGESPQPPTPGEAGKEQAP
jgi:hypothetical protein